MYLDDLEPIAMRIRDDAESWDVNFGDRVNRFTVWFDPTVDSRAPKRMLHCKSPLPLASIDSAFMWANQHIGLKKVLYVVNAQSGRLNITKV